MRIYFIRHAQYDIENMDQGTLTKKGRRQAELTGKRFIDEKVKFDEVYSSTIIRALETAQICTLTTGIPCSIIRSDMLVEDREEEDYEDVAERMRRFVDSIETKCETDTYAIFSHSVAIHCLLKSYDSKNKNLVRLPHTGIAVVDFINNKPKILDYNPRLHIKDCETC